MRRAKVTVAQIKEALTVCQGNVSRAAAILGLARNNLYKRLSGLGMNPETYRPTKGNSDTSTRGATVAPLDTSRAGATGTDVHNSTASSTSTDANPVAAMMGGAIYASGKAPRRLRGMDVAAGIVDSEAPKGKAVPKLARTFYLRPEQVRMIEEALFELYPVLRDRDLSPSKVVERFVDDCFEPWLKATVTRPKPPAKRRGGK